MKNEGATKGIKKEKEISALRAILVSLEQNRQDAIEGGVIINK